MKRNPRFIKPKSKQKGFTLLQLAGGLLISGLVMNSIVKYQFDQAEQKDFEVLGNKIAEHSRAIAEWIVDQGGAAIPTTYTGTDWLKSNADCGITTGGAEAYLPCAFDFKNYPYGADPTTVISNSGGVTVARSTWPAIQVGGVAKSKEVGFTVLQAEADTKDALKGVVTYTENNNAVITSTIDVNNGTGIYVKRSGDNMTGDLGLGGNDINNVGILNASRGQFGIVTTTGDVAVGGDLAARNITARANVTALGSLIATGDVRGRYTYTQRVYDSNNTAYYSDPNGRSRLNTADIVSIRDLNDTTKTLDPSGTSNVKSLRSETMDVSSSFRLTKNEVEGGSCVTKSIGTTSTGKLLACESGVWKAAGGAGSGTKAYLYYCSTDRVMVNVQVQSYKVSSYTSRGADDRDTKTTTCVYHSEIRVY